PLVEQSPEGRHPTAQEADGRHRRHSHHGYVLAQEEQAKADTAVLGVVATHKFGLGLRQVEWGAVGLGYGRSQEGHEGHRLQKYEPEAKLSWGVQARTLRCGDVQQTQAARQ